MDITMTSSLSHKERGSEWVRAAKECLEWKSLKEKAEKHEKRYFEELKALSEGVASRGEGFVFTPSIRKGSVDYKAIPELKGIDLEHYRNDSVETWKLTYELMGE